MIIKMTLPALFRHRKCIAAQTRVETIRDLLDDLDDVDDETILVEERDAYINHAEYLLRTLVEILNERAKSYIETEI